MDRPEVRELNPYYEKDGIVIYHGDCAEILPELEPCGLVSTDPPYGIGKWTHTGGNSISKLEADDLNEWDAVRPPDDVVLAATSAAPVAIVWGGNYFSDILGPCRSPLVWDKRIRGMHFADGEFAWTNFEHGTLRIFDLAIQRGDTYKKKLHPTQKPTSVIEWSIQQSKTEGVIIDPFMGSGTTLRAAKNLGRPAIGIEISERYCEIAANRLAQGVLF